MEIHGYKAFAPDGTNRFGVTFPIGKYHIEGQISFGTSGNGLHFAERLEDTIRYGKDADGIGDVLIAEVIGSGIIAKGEDEYAGFYDMYSASDLEIVRYLSRAEIINYALKLPPYRLKRFVSYFRLTEVEQNLFYGIDISVDLAIDYYQRGMTDIYLLHNVASRFLEKNNKVKVITFGGYTYEWRNYE